MKPASLILTPPESVESANYERFVESAATLFHEAGGNSEQIAAALGIAIVDPMPPFDDGSLVMAYQPSRRSDDPPTITLGLRLPAVTRDACLLIGIGHHVLLHRSEPVYIWGRRTGRPLHTRERREAVDFYARFHDKFGGHVLDDQRGTESIVAMLGLGGALDPPPDPPDAVALPPPAQSSVQGHERRPDSEAPGSVSAPSGTAPSDWIEPPHDLKPERDAPEVAGAGGSGGDVLAPAGAPEDGDGETVGAFLNQWLPTVKPTVASNTFTCYSSQTSVHIIPAIGDIPLRELTHSDVQRMLNGLTNANTGKPLGPHTAHQTKRVLHTALEVAYRDRKIDRNPVKGTKTPRRPESEVVTWTSEQAQQFLAYTRHHRLYPLYVLVLTTGLRQGEALGLRWEDIDLDTATLTPRQQLQHGQLAPLKTRGSGKPVALAEFLVKVLREHREQQAAERSTGDMGLVFTEWNGAALEVSALRRAFKRHASEAGLPVIRFHDLRHGVATFYTTQTNVPIEVAASLLRHDSVAMTAKYSHARVADQREAVDLLGDRLEGAARPVEPERTASVPHMPPPPAATVTRTAVPVPIEQRSRVEEVTATPEHLHERAAVARAGGAMARMLEAGEIIEDPSRPGVFYVEEPPADTTVAS